MQILTWKSPYEKIKKPDQTPANITNTQEKMPKIKLY
jgi:hypothetical protein